MIKSWILDKIIKSQRGNIIVLTAFLLPLFIAFGGLAIDIGNLYAHYSRLQNAADSAAIASGNVFKKNFENNDTSNENYKQTAVNYTTVNEHTEGILYNNKAAHPNDKILVDCQVKAKNGYYALRVKLYEDVPFRFLRPLMAILNAGPDSYYATISASGYCKIIENANGDASIFDNLFTYSESFDSKNNLANHGSMDPQNKDSCSTYDGNIHAANKAALSSTNFEIQNFAVNSHAFDGRDWFYVEEGRNYDKKYKLLEEQKNYPFYDKDINIADYYEKVIKNMETASTTYTIESTSQNNLTSEIINQQIQNGKNAIYTSETFNNGTALEFNINSAILGTPNDEPFYIITGSFGNFNINADLSNCRPLILVASNPGANLRFQSSTKGFNGVLYAPYGDVNINDNRVKFTGSVVAQNISSGEQAYYIQKNYINQGNSGSGLGTVIMGGSDDWDD